MIICVEIYGRRECAAAYQYTELFFSMKYEGKSVLIAGQRG